MGYQYQRELSSLALKGSLSLSSWKNWLLRALPALPDTAETGQQLRSPMGKKQGETDRMLTWDLFPYKTGCVYVLGA